MEAVLSEQKCQCDLQWAGAIGVSGGAGRRTRRMAKSYDKEWYGAGDRNMVIHDGKDASFCRSCRFVCSFIAHLLPFLLTSIILVRFFFPSRNICFPCIYSPSFECFLILLCGVTDEQRFMPPPPVLALLDSTMIFSADA
jgi:hypothetical protein